MAKQDRYLLPKFKFRKSKENGKWHFTYSHGNNETICHSEQYETSRAGLDSVKEMVRRIRTEEVRVVGDDGSCITSFPGSLSHDQAAEISAFLEQEGISDKFRQFLLGRNLKPEDFGL